MVYFKGFLFLLCLNLVNSEEPQASLEPPTPPVEAQDPADLDYAIIFDVGSTGTRAHIHGIAWKAAQCSGKGAVHVYMPGWTFKVKPGLANVLMDSNSTIQDDASDISTRPAESTDEGSKGSRVAPEKEGAESSEHEAEFKAVRLHLAPLEVYIRSMLRPKDLERTTFLIRATGGFRYLPTDAQERGLDHAYSFFKASFPESNMRRSWFRVMTGAEEGAFSWLSLNQLARRFYDPFEHVAVHPQVRTDGSLEKEKANEILKDFSRGDGSRNLEEGTAFPGSRDNWRLEAAGLSDRRVKRRVGLIEVGGASAQVAMEPPVDVREQLLDEMHPFDLSQKDHVLLGHARGHGFHVLNFCSENIVLEIQALDGYGRQAALQNFLKSEAVNQGVEAGQEFLVPCLPADVRIPVTLGGSSRLNINEKSEVKKAETDKDDDDPDLRNFTAPFVSQEQLAYARGMPDGDAQKCRTTLRSFLQSFAHQTKYQAKENAQSKATAVHEPPHDRLKDEELPMFTVDPNYRLYATENFYYFNRYVAQSGEKKLFSVAEWIEKAQMVCAENSVETVSKVVDQSTANEKLESACFGLIFMAELLTSIVRVPTDQILKAVTAVKELDTGFVIGSLIAELPGIYRSMNRRVVEPPRHDEF